MRALLLTLLSLLALACDGDQGDGREGPHQEQVVLVRVGDRGEHEEGPVGEVVAGAHLVLGLLELGHVAAH